LARVRRRFIVSAGTKKARAISSVASPATAPQRQRHLRLDRQRRVAAHEDELEPLVRDGGLGHVVLPTGS
jgi:hypothetical protein